MRYTPCHGYKQTIFKKVRSELQCRVARLRQLDLKRFDVLYIILCDLIELCRHGHRLETLKGIWMSMPLHDQVHHDGLASFKYAKMSLLELKHDEIGQTSLFLHDLLYPLTAHNVFAPPQHPQQHLHQAPYFPSTPPSCSHVVQGPSLSTSGCTSPCLQAMSSWGKWGKKGKGERDGGEKG